MPTNQTLYLLINSLKPTQARDLLASLRSNAEKSGGKWHTHNVFLTAWDSRANSDDEVVKALPDESKKVKLRQVKSQLVKRILSFLSGESDLPHIRLRHLRNEIEILISVGAHEDALSLIGVALPMAIENDKLIDALELADQAQWIHRSVSGSIMEIPKIPIPIEIIGKRGMLPAEIWKLLGRSKEIFNSYDSATATDLLATVAWGSANSYAALYRSVLLRAKFNLECACQRWPSAAKTIRSLVNLIHSGSSPEIKYLKVRLHDLVAQMGVLAIEAPDAVLLKEARAILKSHLHEDENWIAAYYRVEIAILLHANQIPKVMSLAEKLKAELKSLGIESEAAFSTEVYHILAITAFRRKEWGQAASYATQFLLKTNAGSHSRRKAHYIRMIALQQKGDMGKAGNAALFAISNLGRKNLTALDKLIFNLFAASKVTTTSKEFTIRIQTLKREIIDALGAKENVELSGDLDLAVWISQF